MSGDNAYSRRTFLKKSAAADAGSRRPAEHVSTLKLIEKLHGLPTLASRNHQFDVSTPTGGDYESGGQPAPPRDGLESISDLTDLFEFDD